MLMPLYALDYLYWQAAQLGHRHRDFHRRQKMYLAQYRNDVMH